MKTNVFLTIALLVSVVSLNAATPKAASGFFTSISTGLTTAGSTVVGFVVSNAQALVKEPLWNSIITSIYDHRRSLTLSGGAVAAYYAWTHGLSLKCGDCSTKTRKNK